jgi:hypothetical protein
LGDIWSKGDGIAGNWKSSTIYTPHQISFGERGRTRDTYEGGEERDHLEDLGVDGRILNCIGNKQDRIGWWGIVDCNDLIQDMNKSRALVNTLMKPSHKRRGTS